MIIYVSGDLFESPAKVLVNAVNTVGVMGKGIAAQFRQYYPEMYKKYRKLCETNQFNTGQLWLYKTPNKWVLNFPTKKHWRQKSRLEYIEKGLQKFVDSYAERGITEIAFPRLGCGNGELGWSEVRPLMEHYLSSLPITIFIHHYEQKDLIPEGRNPEIIKRWLQSEPALLPFEEFKDDLITLIEQTDYFTSFTGQEEFSIRPEKEGISIDINAENLHFPFYEDDGNQDGLLDLWQFIRDSGIFHQYNLPGQFSQYGDYILGMLAGLDYLRPVKFSNKGAEVQYTGLQLVPVDHPTINLNTRYSDNNHPSFSVEKVS